MANLNEVKLIGRLTKNPEIFNGVTTFSLAISNKYKENEEVTYVDIACFGKLQDVVNKYLKKGQQIYCGGRLKYGTWVDRDTGRNRSKLSVIASNIQFLEPKEKNYGEPPF